jgi:hypothetical protein
MSKLKSKKNQQTEVKVAEKDLEVKDVKVGIEDEDQEIISVSQDKAKRALKALLSKQSGIMAMLYAKHDEYNKQYFNSKLSVPLITIEKMSNKSLGAYNSGADNIGIENHIYMNRNFIALNTEPRILETLKHEMIHQYQDEVLYEKFSEDGNQLHTGAKRPSDWHNKDFKEWAEKIGIVANGRNCTGSPAHMPEAKSYNRKFVCGCIATNGYPLTVWSTREIKAVCQVCGKPFMEVKKSGGTIKVSQSFIEREGEDAVQLTMRKAYNSFERFADKQELNEKLKAIREKDIEYKEGAYQKGCNAYAEGFLYWLAWNSPAAEEEAARKAAEEEAARKAAEEEAARKAAEEEAKLPTADVVANSEPGTVIELPKKKRGRPAKVKTTDVAVTSEVGNEIESKSVGEAADIAPPKKKRGRPAGSKNKKVKGAVVNEEGNATEQTE